MANGPKRHSNPKRKERRQRSWLRGEAKNKRNRERNEAREGANREELARLGGTIKTKTFNKTVAYVNDKGILTTKVVEVTKRESPSEALARTKREDAGWRGHVPMITTNA